MEGLGATEITDIGMAALLRIPDRAREQAFYRRACVAIVEYLNMLGGLGWRVISVQAGSEDPSHTPLPEGRYVLMKEL